MQYSPLSTLHIAGGVLGLLSGAGAMTFRKGSRLHAMTGNVFFVSMLTMAGAGAFMAIVKDQPSNIIAGILTIYLVTTARMTARSKSGQVGVFDWVAMFAATAIGIILVGMGMSAIHAGATPPGGAPAAMYFIIGSIALLCAAGDVRMGACGGVTGAKRLVRHLWRMCFSLFIASGSLFLARPHLFPAFLVRAHVIQLLGFLPLLLMIFWLLRVWFTKTYKRKGPAPAVAVGQFAGAK
jgi:uncharacterized membrane protein